MNRTMDRRLIPLEQATAGGDIRKLLDEDLEQSVELTLAEAGGRTLTAAEEAELAALCGKVRLNTQRLAHLSDEALNAQILGRLGRQGGRRGGSAEGVTVRIAQRGKRRELVHGATRYEIVGAP